MYNREIDGQVYTFGVSGKLWRDALLMYDHQTRSLWSHITGQAVEGTCQGKQLKILVSMPKITWQVWKTNYPETKVLSVAYNPNHPGQQREDEVQDRYRQYHLSSRTGISKIEYNDFRLRNKEQIVGARIDDHYRAYPFSAFEGKAVINDTIDQTPVLVFHHNDSGATAVFLSLLETEKLTFVDHTDYLVRDEQTETLWNLITGTAIEGRLKGKKLKRYPAINVYWFAWARYHPDTTVYR